MLMQVDPEISAVLASYPWLQIQGMEALGSGGGFSGAHLWRLETPDSRLCLRRWPREHPSRHRLAYIHSVLGHVAAKGFSKTPLPLQTHDEGTFVRANGFLWQLEPWSEGQASYQDKPTMHKLVAAMQALAAFHVSAVSFQSASGAAPGMTLRREQFDQFADKDVSALTAQLHQGNWPDFTFRAEQFLDCFRRLAPEARTLVESAEKIKVPIQPCIRDIWHDHVLFIDDEVDAFIDFGALRMDHVAADISRLLGSLVGDDVAARNTGLEAYQAIRQLTTDETWLVETYDRSSNLLAGVNWLRWIAVERREFENRDRVLQRLDQILKRLEARL